MIERLSHSQNFLPASRKVPIRPKQSELWRPTDGGLMPQTHATML